MIDNDDDGDNFNIPVRNTTCNMTFVENERTGFFAEHFGHPEC